MSNALWLLLALPSWYFPLVLSLFDGDILTAIPALGFIALLIGGGKAFLRRDSRLLLFVVPVLLSEGIVAVAGFMRGQLLAGGALVAVVVFLGIQTVLALYLIVRLRGARLAAVALSVFSLSYGAFAAFIAGMSFTDQWL